MQKFWDYTTLANAYSKRANYSLQALNKMYQMMQLTKDSKICDIGAGTGILTLELAKQHFNVIAIEPNDNMRNNGINYTKHMQNILWQNGSAENTFQKSHAFDAVTFGSSFNVCDKQKALIEGKRITKKNGWFACMWNHRDLTDPIQKEIENIIKNHIPDYSYGDRRQDQTEILHKSSFFQSISFIEDIITYNQNIKDCIEAWKSHGTLHRQAKNKFELIIQDIENFLFSLKKEMINIPYLTKIWIAQYK